jgi:hypothetical protein
MVYNKNPGSEQKNKQASNDPTGTAGRWSLDVMRKGLKHTQRDMYATVMPHPAMYNADSMQRTKNKKDTKPRLTQSTIRCK